MFDLAIQAGLRVGVHFLNGPSRSSSKGFERGGAVESMLRSDKVNLELIMDGYHVHPAYVRDVIARKEIDRVIAITDSMFATGMDDLHQFELLGLRGKVSTNRAYLHAIDKADTLFGSVLTMDSGFCNVLNWLTQSMSGTWYRDHQAIPFESALVQTSWLFSRNPAQVMAIYDNTNGKPGTGSIAIGKWADLTIAEITFQDGVYNTHIKKTICQGAIS
jgi:N-acetylglucosamine-6-phosphate deacetylase